jgi:hypothetical protein
MFSWIVSSKRSGDESDDGQTNARHKRKRRSRWAPETEKVSVLLGAATTETGSAISMPPETVKPALTSGM